MYPAYVIHVVGAFAIRYACAAAAVDVAVMSRRTACRTYRGSSTTKTHTHTGKQRVRVRWEGMRVLTVLRQIHTVNRIWIFSELIKVNVRMWASYETGWMKAKKNPDTRITQVHTVVIAIIALYVHGNSTVRERKRERTAWEWASLYFTGMII